MRELSIAITQEELRCNPNAFLRLRAESGSISETLLAARAGLLSARRNGLREAQLLLHCCNTYEFAAAASAIRRMSAARGLRVVIGAHVTTPACACTCDKIIGADFLLLDTEAIVCGLYRIAPQSLYGARYLYPPAGAQAFSPVCVFDTLGLGTLLLLTARVLRERSIPRYLHGRPAWDPEGATFCRENDFSQAVLTAANLSAAADSLATAHGATG